MRFSRRELRFQEAAPFPGSIDPFHCNVFLGLPQEVTAAPPFSMRYNQEATPPSNSMIMS